jgi:hypothetical protein
VLCLPLGDSSLRYLPVQACSQCSEQHNGPEPLCRKCKNSNGKIARRDKALILDAPVAPDPQPARVLRASLSASRRLGVPFEQAWSDALLAALTEAEDDGWSSTFEWSRDEWQHAYHRQANGLRGDFAVLDPETAA